MKFHEHLLGNGLGIDARSLGIIRVLLGCVLLGQLFRSADASLVTLLCALVFGMFAVGYRTRLFQGLAVVGIISSDPRALLLDAFSDVWPAVLAITSMWLPLGRRWSVDALLQSMRARPEHRAEQLADRAAIRPAEPPLITSRIWNAVDQRARRGGTRLTCFFDSDCGICFQFARVLARIDTWERIQIVSNQDRERLPQHVSDDLVASTIVVHNHQTGRTTTRSDAIAELCRALPFGWPIWAILKFPGLRSVWLRLYDVVARNRVAISRFFGLDACRLPSTFALRGESDGGL